MKKHGMMFFLVFLGLTQLAWFLILPQDFRARWVKNPIVAHVIQEHNLVEEKSKLVAVSYYYPYFKYFSDIVTGVERPKKEWMEGYYFGRPYIFHSYYNLSVELLPDLDAPHSLLGFCEYYMGDLDAARAQYEKSADLNPFFFWNFYNLGIIYFEQGNFLKSAVALSKALSLKMEYSLLILNQSAYYRQIWKNVPNPPKILSDNLDRGHKDAALLLAACLIKEGASPQALQLIRSFGPGINWHQELWVYLYLKAGSRQPLAGDFDHLIQGQIPVRIF